ncbi:hypothetical protein RND71_010350 [Anisodus tanguticus]|uniref:Uncharacterized protein n=1 Tax=Anisodus tanguticus TaxID=243964 RepID=A0AAE1SJ16_9SOLA|nr:hypothetical protein RND71_010350 [Anisodus tanguticus]
MLSSMSMELQRQHENMGPNEMLEHLKSLYDSQSQTMEYELLIELFKCKLNEGGQVSQHVLKMIELIERVASIGTKLEKNVATTLILNSLPRSFENFIVNFNMNGTKATLPELHNMLKTFESSVSKGKAMLMVSSSSRPKPKGKECQKKKGKAVAAPSAMKPKGDLTISGKLRKFKDTVNVYTIAAFTGEKGGMTWKHLNDPENGLKQALIIMLLEWIVVLLAAFYLDQINSSGKSPLFFLGNSWKKQTVSTMNLLEKKESELS